MIQKVDKVLVVELGLVMNDMPVFMKYLRDFFYNVKTKGRDRRRVYTKRLLLYNISIEDLIEIEKEELSKFRFCMKL